MSRRHFFHDGVPERHGVNDPVRFGGRRQFPCPGGGKVKGELCNSFDGDPAESRLLGYVLPRCANAYMGADVGVLAFGILKDNH